MIRELRRRIWRDFAEHPSAVLGGAFGALGLLNVLDSLVESVVGRAWEYLDPLRPLFVLLRTATRICLEPLELWIGFTLPDVFRDYIAMGLIVAGMRLRSTAVLTRAIREGAIYEYKESIFGRTLAVWSGSGASVWVGFYAWRLLVAFLFWPVKLGGAAIRYGTGKLRERIEGPRWKEIRTKQYVSFFSAALIAVAIVFLLLMADIGVKAWGLVS